MKYTAVQWWRTCLVRVQLSQWSTRDGQRKESPLNSWLWGPRTAPASRGLLVKPSQWEGKWALWGDRKEDWTRVTSLHPQKSLHVQPHGPRSSHVTLVSLRTSQLKPQQPGKPRLRLKWATPPPLHKLCPPARAAWLQHIGFNGHFEPPEATEPGVCDLAYASPGGCCRCHGWQFWALSQFEFSKCLTSFVWGLWLSTKFHLCCPLKMPKF